MQRHYQVNFDTSLDWQAGAAWQTPDTPFMQFAFWQALFDSRAIGAGSDWLAMFALVKDEAGALVLAMPVFVKDHHQGEYVFDHAWAEAFGRYRLDYYPRLVTSVPFTPVTGARVWLAQGEILTPALWQVLTQAIDQLAIPLKASTWHGLFLPRELTEVDALLEAPHETRLGCQFMWFNQNSHGDKLQDFDDFLGILTAKKRKSIKVERQKVAAQGLTCRTKLGAEITAEDWHVFYQCYAMTYLVRGRRPYLSLDFFERIGQSMPEQLMLAQALDPDGSVVACALFFYDAIREVSTLYGRYWGSLAEYDSLHFELCYYQGIEFAIHQGLLRFDPGTQGEHKLIRGFRPVLSYSLHRVYDTRFLPAIRHYCDEERSGVLGYYQAALDAVPFNQAYLDSLVQHAHNLGHP